MRKNLPYKGCNQPGACLCYHFTTSCAGRSGIQNAVSCNSGALSLAPGCVMEDSGLAGCAYAAEIYLPPCETSDIDQVTVRLEEPCQTVCDIEADNPLACSSACIWTSTCKRASAAAATVGDTITYSVAFTNHSSIQLDMVQIFDEIPAGVTVIPDSIRPNPQPGETLRTGISMGKLAAGETAMLTYQVKINCDAVGDLVNCAWAAYCYTDCRGCRMYGMGSCKSSKVRLLLDDCKISVIKSANKDSVCSLCEEIMYTLKISNPGKRTITDVIVYDNIPLGLCYQSTSTTKNGSEFTNENPQNGIYLGTLKPGETTTVTFVLSVCSAPCRSRFENSACVCGRAGAVTISAKSNVWVVTFRDNCLCQQIRRRFSICDFSCLKGHYVYHTGAAYYNMGFMKLVSAGFGIKIEYIDCNGKKRRKSFESSVIFYNLPNNFNPNHFTVWFTNLVCDVDRCGNLMAQFDAALLYDVMPESGKGHQ